MVVKEQESPRKLPLARGLRHVFSVVGGGRQLAGPVQEAFARKNHAFLEKSAMHGKAIHRRIYLLASVSRPGGASRDQQLVTSWNGCAGRMLAHKSLCVLSSSNLVFHVKHGTDRYFLDTYRMGWDLLGPVP